MKEPAPVWSTPPENITVHDGELHIWRAKLDVPEGLFDKFIVLLSQEEVERARRLYFAKDRDHFVVSHAFVRDVLSRYLSIHPEKLSFVQNSYGKPALPIGRNHIGIEFNLTHSNPFALVAVTRGSKVGIDIELIRADFVGLNLARRFFSPEEYRSLISLPEEQQSEAFFRCWTRKEAYIKARGKGLSLPLNEFDVPVDPGESFPLLMTMKDSCGTAWRTMMQVDPAPGYTGSVVVEGNVSQIKFWDWHPEMEIDHSSGYSHSQLDP